MIGQQKRLLEHTASSKPVKYQKHSDDKSCDAHARVVSLTDEKKLEFEQHFSGVSQKNAFSVSPGAGSDSMKVFERVLASEIKHMPQKDKDTSEPETGVYCGSHDKSALSDEHEVVKIANDPCSQNAKECTVEGCEEDVGYSSDKVIETQGGGTLGTRQWIRGAGFSPLIGSGVSTSEENDRNNWCAPGSPARDLHVQLFGDEEELGLIEDDQGLNLPSTADNNTEGGSFHATVRHPSTPCSQSLPILLNDKVIDLYAMDEKVEGYGGYEIVTSKGLWGTISEALGLGSHCGPGVKLIYFKHLRRLERDRGLLLERHQDSGLIDAVNIRRPALLTVNGLLDEKGENYSLTGSEQFAESEPFLEKSGEQPVNGRSSNVSRVDTLHDDHSDDETEIGSVKRDRESAKLCSPYRTGGYPFMGNCSFSQECQDFPDAFLADHRLFKASVEHHGDGPSKQKRELVSNAEEQVVYDVATIERFKKSLADTLTWIKRTAVEPGNPRMGQGPEGTGQDEKWARDCASQAQKARTVLWRQKEDTRPGDGHSHQVKQQIPPPSQYYEDSTRQEQQAPHRTRPTRERAARHGSSSAQKPFNESVNYQSSSSPSFNQHTPWVAQTSRRISRHNHHYYSEERYPDELLDIPKNRKRVPIGEDFQADIPTFWSVDRHLSAVGASGDETQSSDGNDEEDHSRWLGKQVWPPPGGQRLAYNDHYFGRSRPSVCSCLNPESINCVRLHIEEERDRLKEELGQAFYIWKFDQMGESVAAEWTKDEQHTYQSLVQLNPPSRGKNFWDQLPEAFPGKSMKELVSFYFNIFVLRRRAIQNRLDAQHLDSDDDETNYPEYDSEDSEDDYESGDEGDEEDDPNASDDEDETDKEDDAPSGSDSSAKLLEDTSFCDLEGYCSKMGVTSPLDEAQGLQMTVRTARLMNLEDVQQGYHDPHQEEIDVRLGTAHMTAKWSQDEHEDEKHLEDDHVSVVGEEELQEVKTWEASHWDEADHDDLGHDPVAKGISKCDQTPERDLSPLYKKPVEATNQHTSLMGSCEGEVWGPTMDIPQTNKREKLLSTNGMIQEFFGNGNEASGLNATS